MKKTLETIKGWLLVTGGMAMISGGYMLQTADTNGVPKAVAIGLLWYGVPAVFLGFVFPTGKDN